MELRRDTWDRWHSSPTYLAGGHCTLPVPVVSWYHLSKCQLSVAGPSMSLVPVFGTCCRRRSRQFSHCRHSVCISRHSSSGNLILMSFYEAETLLSVGFSDCYFLFLVFVFFFISLNLEVALLFRRFPIDWLIDWMQKHPQTEYSDRICLRDTW